MSILEFKDWINEGVFTFGKYKGLDHTDPKVDVGWLRWAIENVKNPSQISPQFRKEINAEIIKRSTPKPIVTPPVIPVAKSWIKAIAIADGFGLKTGQSVALSKHTDGNWDYVTLDGGKRKGVIPATQVANIVKSIKDAQNKPVKIIPDETEEFIDDDASTPAPVPPTKPGKRRIFTAEEMPPGSEQQQIDERFAKLMSDSKQSHIMISALAGAGKTSLLQHLAWKYGKPGQKWLYLVFNTKNKVEGTEKFPKEWVEVQTTNSFLGRLLRSAKNIERLPQTELMVKLQGKSGDTKNLEKSRIIADSPEFARLLEKAGIPDPRVAGTRGEDQYQRKALESLVSSMRYVFKESVLTLLGLAKSFAATPETASEKIDNILSKYDIDTDMSDIKERIQKYSPSFAAPLKRHLKAILGYDFLSHNFEKDIKEATIWMLHETLPQNTNQKLTVGEDEYELGQFRDFNDDLWYTALHADQLHWPHYDVVLADEVQDFNEVQKIVLKKLHDAGAKIVAVGDKNQCHPAGTMIALTGGGEKPIEEIKVGDELVTYNTKKSFFPGVNTQGRKVEAITARKYEGDMVIIKTENKTQYCTPNHKCLVKVNKEEKSFITHACNLVSGMLVRTFDGTNRGGSWESIEIAREYKNYLVYSLKVEPTEGQRRLYIANGIVTHNSIYRFRGADGDAFDNLGTMLKDLSHDKNVSYTLTKNFRSKSEILDFVNSRTHVNNLVAGKKPDPLNPGVVTDGKLQYKDVFNTIANERKTGKIKETAFISRTNEPLVHAALKLLGSGVPFVIVGKDVAQDLVKHIGKVMKMNRINDFSPIQNLLNNLDNHLQSELEKFSGHSTKKNYLKELDETTTALISAIEQFDPHDPYDTQIKSNSRGKTVAEFKMWLKAKLGGFDIQENEADLMNFREKVEKEKPIILTTAHKSKGLEFERVYILRDDQFPHHRAKRPEDKLQEENARYVAYTRAIDELHILDKKGQPGVKD